MCIWIYELNLFWIIMANRILAGNRSAGGMGLYVSRPTENVLTCTGDELMFSTNHGETGSNFVTAGHFQVVPVSGGTGGTAPVATSTTTLSSGATATVSYQNFASTKLLNWGISTVFSFTSGNGGTYDYSSIGSTSATLTNNASASRTVTNLTYNLLNSSALF